MKWLMVFIRIVSIHKYNLTILTEEEVITMIKFSTLSQRISAITEENAMYTKGQVIVLN